jgi:hypothetical protein
VQWIAEIVRNGDRPEFVLTLESDPGRRFVGTAPQSTCEKLRSEMGIEEVISGSEMFLLDHPEVVKGIEALPRASEVQGYLPDGKEASGEEEEEKEKRVRPGGRRGRWRRGGRRRRGAAN